MTVLREIREGWDKAAAEDPMFNVLTLPEKEGCWDPEEFYAHGRHEVALLAEFLQNELGLDVWHRALDFGCGPGRLTRALSLYFDEVVGVDISRTMLDFARDHTTERNVTYVLNVAANLRRVTQDVGVAGFDLVYSAITLQHIPRNTQGRYVREFVRLLSDEGFAVFQVNEGGHLPNGHLSMYGVDRERVTGWVEGAGGEVVDVLPSAHSGSDEWPGFAYVVRRAR